MKAIRPMSMVLICLLIACAGKPAEMQQATEQEDKLGVAERAYQQGVELIGKNTAQSTRDAIAKFQEAQRLYEATGYKQGEADALFSIGVLSAGLGRIEDAINAYNRALKVVKKVVWERLSPTRSDLAGLYVSLGEYDKAIELSLLDIEEIGLGGFQEYFLGKDRSYFWVVTKNSLASYELPKGAEIEAAAVEFRQALQSMGLDRKRRLRKTRAKRVYTEASGRPTEELARKLSAMLLMPAASSLAGKRLVVIPDGALQYIPFAALADPCRVGAERVALASTFLHSPLRTGLAPFNASGSPSVGLSQFSLCGSQCTTSRGFPVDLRLPAS